MLINTRIYINCLFFAVNFESACAYQQQRRNYPPARYNYSSQWLRPRAARHYAGQTFARLFRQNPSSGNLDKKPDENKFLYVLLHSIFSTYFSGN